MPETDERICKLNIIFGTRSDSNSARQYRIPGYFVSVHSDEHAQSIQLCMSVLTYSRLARFSVLGLKVAFNLLRIELFFSVGAIGSFDLLGKLLDKRVLLSELILEYSDLLFPSP